MRLLFACALVAVIGGVARADDAFDPKGWKLLGKRSISNKTDATTTLRNYDGNLDELTVVFRGAMTLHRVRIDHTNLDDVGETIERSFDDDRHSVLVDLTDNQDTLEAVTLDIDEPEHPVAVWIFGRDRRHPEPVVVADPDAAGFGGKEWSSLGAVDLDASVAGTIGTGNRIWTRLAFVATADLDLLALAFHTTGGDWIPYLTMKLRGGGGFAIVDLPGARRVTSIDFEYTILGATAAKLRVYGMLDESASTAVAAAATSVEEVEAVEAEPDPPKPTIAPVRHAFALPTPTDDDGWTLLGEDQVDLVDDEIEIRRKKSTWSKIKLVVLGDDVGVTAIDVHLAKTKKPQHEDLDQAFTDGSTRVIDITGKRSAIQKVRLTYVKHSLDASTRVQVYAR